MKYFSLHVQGNVIQLERLYMLKQSVVYRKLLEKLYSINALVEQYTRLIVNFFQVNTIAYIWVFFLNIYVAFSYTCPCRIHTDAMNNRRRKTSLTKYLLLTLLQGFEKGYSRFACERKLGTEQKL